MPTQASGHNFAYVMYICLVAALGGLLFGFDSSVISGAIEPLSEYYQLNPASTGWAVSNVIIGCVVGCFSAGMIADKYGRKKTLIVTAVLFTISAVGSALATDFWVFVIFRMIGGLGIGIASVISPVYIAEVAPKDIRGRAMTMNMICCVGGQVVVLITNYLIARGASNEWLVDQGWRWMLGSEFVPCLLFLLFVGMIPESPRWSAMVGHDENALKALTKISNAEHAKKVLQEIKESINLDAASQASLEKVKFNKKTAIFLIIGIGLAVFNQLTGINVIQYFGPSLLMNVTDSVQEAMYMTIFLASLQFVGVCVGMVLIDSLGRKVLLLWGSIGSAICLLVTFGTFYLGIKGFTSVIGLFGFMFIFGVTWAQVVWAVIGEVFPNRLRAVGMGVSIATMWISNFIISQTFPIMNKSIWLTEKFHGGFPLLLFAVCCLVSWFFVKVYVPETKGVPLEKMEDLVLKRHPIANDDAQPKSEHTVSN